MARKTLRYGVPDGGFSSRSGAGGLQHGPRRSTSGLQEKRRAMGYRDSTVIDLAAERIKRQESQQETRQQMTFDIEVDQEGQS